MYIKPPAYGILTRRIHGISNPFFDILTLPWYIDPTTYGILTSLYYQGISNPLLMVFFTPLFSIHIDSPAYGIFDPHFLSIVCRTASIWYFDSFAHPIHGILNPLFMVF